MKGVNQVDQETVDRSRKEAEEAYIKLSLLKDAFWKAESDYMRKVSRFRNFDYELAQTDGRLKKIPSSTQRKEKKQPELTLDQLKSIALKLGFDLTQVDEAEEQDEEITEAIMEDIAGQHCSNCDCGEVRLLMTALDILQK
jgi:hypothetical protein